VKLTENDHCFLIENYFSPGIIAGFTKANISGDLPCDLNKVLLSLDVKTSVSFLNQLHSGIVSYIDKPGVYDGDGLFTTSKNNTLAIRTADCLPIFFEDLNTKTIGLIHMGWRSAKRKILNGIRGDLYSSKLVAGVGLRKCCYEVRGDFLKIPEFLPCIEKKDKKIYFDPILFVKTILQTQGLDSNSLLDVGICSSCSKKNFYSYRRNKTNSRTLSFILKR